jgi:hypothetical protein
MLTNMEIPLRSTEATKSLLFHTRSSFCPSDSSLGIQRADFFTRPKSSLRIPDGPKTHSMGSSKRPGVNLPVIGYGGSHRGDEIRRANGFLGVEMALIAGVFFRPLAA